MFAKKRRFHVVALTLLIALAFASTTPVFAASTTRFNNPIVANGADPSVVYSNGYYYLAQSDGDIWVTKSKTLSGLGSGLRVRVWDSPASGAYCCEIWAPEIQFINSKFYIYFAADDGNNNNHRMYALESTGTDPQGAYTFRGKLAATTDRWAIDGAVMQKGTSLSFVWSGWQGTTNVDQRIYIAPMSNPYTISGERVQLSAPDQGWERVVGSPYINEGPEPILRNGKMFIVYSANGSWSDEYCLGWLSASDTANPLTASAWTKSSGCVFSKRDTAYGPGHNSFIKSPDNTEDWLVYHANTVSGSSWSGRSIRAQKFTWDGSGNPVFGTPAAIYDAIPLPSGETTSVGRYEAEHATINRAATRSACCGASNGQAVGAIDFADSYVQFNNVYVPKAGTYAISIRFGNGTGSNSTHNVTVNGGAQGSVTYPNTGWDNWTTVTKQVPLNAGNNTIRLTKGTQYAEVDYLELPRYEAEFATINNATITNHAAASNGQKVGNIDFADSYVDFSVNVPSAGSYTMRVLHSTGAGASTHNVSVNDGASFAINYANNGWDNWTAVTASVSLTAGSNRIRFAKGTNYTELDYIEIYK